MGQPIHQSDCQSTLDWWELLQGRNSCPEIARCLGLATRVNSSGPTLVTVSPFYNMFHGRMYRSSSVANSSTPIMAAHGLTKHIYFPAHSPRCFIQKSYTNHRAVPATTSTSTRLLSFSQKGGLSSEASPEPTRSLNLSFSWLFLRA